MTLTCLKRGSIGGKIDRISVKKSDVDDVGSLLESVCAIKKIEDQKIDFNKYEETFSFDQRTYGEKLLQEKEIEKLSMQKL